MTNITAAFSWAWEPKPASQSRSVGASLLALTLCRLWCEWETCCCLVAVTNTWPKQLKEGRVSLASQLEGTGVRSSWEWRMLVLNSVTPFNIVWDPSPQSGPSHIWDGSFHINQCNWGNCTQTCLVLSDSASCQTDNYTSNHSYPFIPLFRGLDSVTPKLLPTTPSLQNNQLPLTI